MLFNLIEHAAKKSKEVEGKKGRGGKYDVKVGEIEEQEGDREKRE